MFEIADVSGFPSLTGWIVTDLWRVRAVLATLIAKPYRPQKENLENGTSAIGCLFLSTQLVSGQMVSGNGQLIKDLAANVRLMNRDPFDPYAFEGR